MQIAGNDPAMMAEAAQFNVSRGAQIIDINMGCPRRRCTRPMLVPLAARRGSLRAYPRGGGRTVGAGHAEDAHRLEPEPQCHSHREIARTPEFRR